MMNPYADLHCHSSCSDGSFTPIELIDHALSVGLKGLSITDHDTSAAYQEALPYAESKGFKLISGIEFSTLHKGESVHILGYGYKLNHRAILDLCAFHHNRRQARNSAILEKLTHAGMPVNEEELALESKEITGRPHIANVMIQKGYVDSVNEAFKKYIGEGKPCYVEGKGISTEESISAIKEAGGFAVIAHPHLIKSAALLKDLLKQDFDGIEVFYARFPKSQEERYLRIAQEKGWLITGGSDFHGTVKPTIPLGCSWVDESLFAPLYARFKENNS